MRNSIIKTLAIAALLAGIGPYLIAPSSAAQGYEPGNSSDREIAATHFDDLYGVE